MTPGGEEVSLLGFGAAPIGNLSRVVSDAQARETLEAAWAGGIRAYDTAPHYGLGLSERRLGAFLREKPRDKFVLSTKVGRLLEPNPDFAGGRDLASGFDVPDDLVRRFDPSLPGIRRSLEDSLERMGLDRIDIAYLHDPDAYDLERGLGEGLPALEQLRSEGLVGQIGVGVNDAAVAARAVREADLDVVMVAGRCSLLRPHGFDDLVPVCIERGTRIVAASPFNSGLLATPHPAPGALFDYAPASAALLAHVEQLATVCEQHGVDLPTAALHFPLRLPQVVSVMVGTARPEQVRENIARMTTVVPDALWDALQTEKDQTP
ncbi:aldo/keto reductase [Microbacterium protaetiae]|uniref:Aldo/keto reductase n=1 Tax=Microbacterium protaetiae TaxID=2509458 RepID=A0A4P6EL54_9MICO|nr:aldo/keto reductase [Microbacterium protaetiae]QAY58598.1 aldo/keto reductase [Microbacterium protaetiae]